MAKTVENNTNSSIIIRVTYETWDIFFYKISHAFISAKGVIRLLLSFFFLASAVLFREKIELALFLALIAFGSLNVFISPVIFLIQSVQAAKNRKTLIFTFLSEKITVSENNRTVQFKWKDLALTVWYRHFLILYTAPEQAFILPVRQMEGQEEMLRTLSREEADPNRFVQHRLL